NEGKNKGKLAGENYTLPSNFMLQNGRGYVPLAAVPDVLLRLTALEVEFHPASRRLFLGNTAQRFTMELRNDNNSRLFISFPAAVNPSIDTAPGHVHLTFRREPAPPPVAQPTEPAAQPPSNAPVGTPQPQKPSAPRFLVLIDAAHGGADIGA